MSEVRRSLVAGAGVALAASLVYVGSVLRDRVDLGGLDHAREITSRQPLLVSRDNEVNVPVGEFYDQMEKLLKQQYVEPITDDMKLASGAVRGMVLSLNDPRSQFMDKDQFRVFLNAKAGKYEGIGADFVLVTPTGKQVVPELAPGLNVAPEDVEEAIAMTPKIPRLVTALVVPGGPADKAGLKPGDVITSVDGRWVADSNLLATFREANRLFLAKKIPYSKINELSKELHKKTERAFMPIRAKDRLVAGASGVVSVAWTHGTKAMSGKIAKAECAMPTAPIRDNAYVLRLNSSDTEDFRRFVTGKRQVTIDLRNNLHGDFEVMKHCLADVAPDGSYGELTTQRSTLTTPFTVAKGNPNPPKLTLLVDQSTRGAAEIFALALSTHAKASLIGSQTGGDRSVSQIVELPDGTGYTMVTAMYRATPEKATGGRK